MTVSKISDRAQKRLSQMAYMTTMRKRCILHSFFKFKCIRYIGSSCSKKCVGVGRKSALE